MKKALLLAAALLMACAPKGAASPKVEAGRFAKAYSTALEAEQMDSAAGEKYLDAIDLAIDDSELPGALAVASASLDALVTGSAPGMGGIGAPTAIAFRSQKGMRTVVRRLERAWEQG